MTSIAHIETHQCSVKESVSYTHLDVYKRQHMMDGNNQMMPQDGMGPNNGQHMYQNCQNQMMPQDGMGRNNGQYMDQNGQMPPQGPGPQQSNGNASQQQTGQGAPQTTQN